ncbi:MAG: thioredoxin [Candidatus Nealsonbacteria bacterium]
MIEITDQNFDLEIKKFEKPVLVDFFADWCAPCTILAPILDSVVKKAGDKIEFLKVNLDNIPLAAQKLGIDRIPTVVLFKNGNPISGFIGVQQEEMINSWFEKALSGGGNETIEQMIERYENYAKENGFKLNPDKKIVESLMRGLLKNEKKHGKKYCPCRRVVGKPEEDDFKICPCHWHKEEIKKDGHCLCLLFVE